MNVVALYIDVKGPYPKLLDKWYDVKKDATKYKGPFPIVAHPPCGKWGNLSHFSKEKTKNLGIIALRQVRKYGGVLEHPRFSKLFADLPLPGCSDEFGFTIEVSQCDFGHVAKKWTWLYICGFKGRLPKLPEQRQPTHWCSGTRTKGFRGTVPPGIKICSPQQRRRTPVDFAKFLIKIASKCR